MAIRLIEAIPGQINTEVSSGSGGYIISCDFDMLSIIDQEIKHKYKRRSKKIVDLKT